MQSRAELIIKYNAMRDSYLALAKELTEIRRTFEDALVRLGELQNTIIQKGEWGYK